MEKQDSLIGRRFHNLTVISRSFSKKGTGQYVCRCDCGNEKVVARNSFIRGKTKSCGCLRSGRKMKHGQSRKSGYLSWLHMMQRCYWPPCPAYKNYGARGLKVCERWHDVKVFLADMGEPNGLTLERVDNEKGYFKENCIWADVKTQARNRRTTLRLTIDGQTKCLKEWAEIYGRTYGTVHDRISRGWDVKRALETPSGPAFGFHLK